jgi:hypothetical protein
VNLDITLEVHEYVCYKIFLFPDEALKAVYRHTFFGNVSHGWAQIQRLFPPGWPQEQMAVNRRLSSPAN